MDRPLRYYNRLSAFAFLVLVGLVSLQVLWLVNAVQVREREIIHQLKEVVGNAGIEVNSLNHASFHGSFIGLENISTDTITTKLNAYLESQGIEGETFFAVFQDSSGGMFKSNAPALEQELRQSEVRTCMSCIVSFWTVPAEDSSALHEMDTTQIVERSVFQYYSPVSMAEEKSGQTLWLALYQPGTLSRALRSMIFLFALNVILLLVLLGLFRHLLRSLSRHKQSSQVKNDFFNNMTHEFKTPISSIRLASRVLRKEMDPEKRSRYHDLIEKESRSLEQQIDKLLELSLLESNELSLEKEPLDLCALLAEIPIRLRPLIENKNAQLHIDCGGSHFHIRGDAYHLLNSFCNLVENSLKYSPPGVQLSITARQTAKKLHLSFRDNGPGIPEQDRNQIFSRFFRGEQDGRAKGSGFGIGLSYVKSIIEGHGGSIRLGAAAATGTEMIIEF